jgi:hypothetical protein
MAKANLEDRVKAIEARNRKVELDKAWEVSAARRFVLFIITFILSYAFLKIIEDEHPLANSILAAVGFVLSTLTVSYLKNLWITKQ